jgi:hypothetical protein
MVVGTRQPVSLAFDQAAFSARTVLALKAL